MKKISIIVALAAAAICSCTKQDAQSASGSASDLTGKVNLCISVPTQTKVTDISSEDAVNSLQVFVFNSAGTSLEAYSSGSASSLSVSVSTGTKKIAAVVNAGAVPGITTLAQLRAVTTSLDDNSAGSFLMYGETEPVSVLSDASVTVSVARLVARVGIASVTNAMTLEQYRSTPIRIARIYLVNVVGNSNFASDAVASSWLNPRSESGSVSGLLCETLPSVTVAYEASHGTGHYFYCYPNAVTTDSSSPDWCPRMTRLVVEAVIDGNTWYYPVTIPEIRPNYSYTISNLTITRPGAASPDEPVTTGSAAFSVEVVPWTDGGTGSVTI